MYLILLIQIVNNTNIILHALSSFTNIEVLEWFNTSVNRITKPYPQPQPIPIIYSTKQFPCLQTAYHLQNKSTEHLKYIPPKPKFNLQLMQYILGDWCQHAEITDSFQELYKGSWLMEGCSGMLQLVQVYRVMWGHNFPVPLLRLDQFRKLNQVHKIYHSSFSQQRILPICQNITIVCSQDYVYRTIMNVLKHEELIRLFEKYPFWEYGQRIKIECVGEDVYVWIKNEKYHGKRWIYGGSYWKNWLQSIAQ